MNDLLEMIYHNIVICPMPLLTSVWMASNKSCFCVNWPLGVFGCGTDRFSCASRALASPSRTSKLFSVCYQQQHDK